MTETSARDRALLRIAHLGRLRFEDAEAYVESVSRRIGEKDSGVVASAIAQLMSKGKPFKAKDVARVVKAGPAAVSGEVGRAVVRNADAAGPASSDDDEEPFHPVPVPDAETRRDTRLRFEQWAKNPRCQANVLSAVHGVSMAEVARSEGLVPSTGQSPFALARGQMFEGRLFRNRAERLIPALAEQGVLPTPAAEFVDVRLTRLGGPCRTLDESKAATDALLGAVAGGRTGKRAFVVAGATIRIPGGGMLPEAILVVDALVIRQDLVPARLIVGEVKTYPDRAGYTDPKELAVARAQAGVYVQGLRLVVKDLGLAERLVVSTKGFLVLSRPGSNAPSVRAEEDLEFQAVRADRGFEKLRQAAAALPPRGGDLIAAIRAAATTYGEACLSFCDRAPACWGRAVAAGDAAILGDDVARWVGLVGLHRALELLEGRPARTAAERDLLQRIEDARLPEIGR